MLKIADDPRYSLFLMFCKFANGQNTKTKEANNKGRLYFIKALMWATTKI